MPMIITVLLYYAGAAIGTLQPLQASILKQKQQ
jgi:hypothetical protein